MTEGFRARLEDDQRGMVADPEPSSSALLVAFGGIAHRLAMPPFEFFRLASALEVNKVFLRDLDESWYHCGVRGMSTDVDSTAEALQRIVRETGAERVVFTGNSAGGYASLLFGALSPTPVTVHAFSAQTFLGRRTRLLAFDRRWEKQIRRVQRIDGSSPTMDLRKVISGTDGRSTLHLHYGRAHRLDRLHAERLRGLPGVRLHPEESKRHDVIKALRDRGELGPVIAEALFAT
jgi:hypothetical protein